MANNITKEDLIVTYKTVTELADIYGLTMDTSFIRTRSKIAFAVMDILIKEHIKQNNG